MQIFDGGAAEWNALIQQLPNPHLLQTWEWAQVKAAYGWQPMPVVWRAGGGTTPAVAAAMILKKQILRRGFAARLCILYVPKGPLMDWSDSKRRGDVLGDLFDMARKNRAIFVKIDPDVLLGRGVPGTGEAREDVGGQALESELRRGGWLFALDQIQFRNSVWIDLTETESKILARMSQKARYNVRLAEKKGVMIREAGIDDLPGLYRMYAETSARDGFVIRDEGYYRHVWGTFMDVTRGGQAPRAEALIAEVEDEPVAALFLFHFARRAYYLYGMSRLAHREKMPNHLLQWEAIRRAKRLGCDVYDLWGAPDRFEPEDSMWGVFRFKQGFGGEVIRTLGAWDYPASPFWYRMYTGVVPRVLEIMRSRGREKTRRDLAPA